MFSRVVCVEKKALGRRRVRTWGEFVGELVIQDGPEVHISGESEHLTAPNTTSERKSACQAHARWCADQDVHVRDRGLESVQACEGHEPLRGGPNDVLLQHAVADVDLHEGQVQGLRRASERKSPCATRARDNAAR